ncbi:hypothetical protein EXIGLDRAFT_86245 [Exidia glandulosa HHB12029]|uniref:Uncharacterized protein n=1 Tax=Exidia glandulosa HHB12029 TaxID=1314781 RepID=A0A165HEV4_EXIGL|nr:hypothetical protein EXIGLDRAFT_86245 [Exidia glandulosa HHB12029]
MAWISDIKNSSSVQFTGFWVTFVETTCDVQDSQVIAIDSTAGGLEATVDYERIPIDRWRSHDRLYSKRLESGSVGADTDTGTRYGCVRMHFSCESCKRYSESCLVCVCTPGARTTRCSLRGAERERERLTEAERGLGITGTIRRTRHGVSTYCTLVCVSRVCSPPDWCVCAGIGRL